MKTKKQHSIGRFDGILFYDLAGDMLETRVRLWTSIYLQIKNFKWIEEQDQEPAV